MARLRKMPETLEGHYTKRQLLDKEHEANAAKSPRDLFHAMPDDLIDETARNEWKRITGILEEVELVGDLDICNLIGYCNAYSLYVKATKSAAAQSMILETSKGGVMQNPLINIQDKYAAQMRNFATKAGLSIDTRLKYATLKVKKSDDEIEDAFGNI